MIFSQHRQKNACKALAKRHSSAPASVVAEGRSYAQPLMAHEGHSGIAHVQWGPSPGIKHGEESPPPQCRIDSFLYTQAVDRVSVGRCLDSVEGIQEILTEALSEFYGTRHNSIRVWPK